MLAAVNVFCQLSLLDAFIGGKYKELGLAVTNGADDAVANPLEWVR